MYSSHAGIQLLCSQPWEGQVYVRVYANKHTHTHTVSSWFVQLPTLGEACWGSASLQCIDHRADRTAVPAHRSD